MDGWSRPIDSVNAHSILLAFFLPVNRRWAARFWSAPVLWRFSFGALGANRKRQRTGAVQDAVVRRQIQGFNERSSLSRPVPMNPLRRAGVLDCGDEVFGVAALGQGGRVRGEFRNLERSQSQSGAFADTVTALQNLADRRRIHGEGERNLE